MERCGEAAVALLDILGFTARASGLPAVDARRRFLDPLLKAALDAEAFLNLDFKRARVDARFEFMQFADTVALVLPRANEGLLGKPEQVVESLAYGCALVIGSALWSGIPLRGALAYGEVMRSNDPAYLLGAAVFDAHAQASNQEWAGAVLCDSAVGVLAQGDTLRCVEWSVPVKGGASELRWCVNWPMHSDGPDVQRPDLDGRMIGGPTPDWDACFGRDDEDGLEKRMNMKAFFEFQQRNCRAYAPRVGPETVKNPEAWRQLYDGRR